MKVTTAEGHSFRVEIDEIDVTSNVPEPDPDWRHIDSEGHEHRWHNLKRDGPWSSGGELPTLRYVVDDRWIEEGEVRTEGHYECTICGDTVEGMRKMPPPIRRTMPGLRHYFIHDEPVDEGEFKRRVAEVQAARG